MIKKIRNEIVRFIASFIPNFEAKERFKNKFLTRKTQLAIKSKVYGKIYLPYYSGTLLPDKKPKIYNERGGGMDIFFIRDSISACTPYLHQSKYFLWDRYNIGLDTHFYTHSTMLDTMGKPKRRYGLFVESEAIVERDYQIFEKYKGIEKDFDAIFTYSEKLLNTLDNAKYHPACSEIWYSKECRSGLYDSAKLDENIYQTKTKNVSIICSNKTITKMHKIRHRFAADALASGKIDVFGGCRGGKNLLFKSESLKDYRFQIVVENGVFPYYYTEKIMDCFASMTIPIYLGATKIEEFFNPNGIIKINENTKIEEILKYCNEQEYNSRLEAIKENYQRALKYLNLDDLLYEQYFKENNK